MWKLSLELYEAMNKHILRIYVASFRSKRLYDIVVAHIYVYQGDFSLQRWNNIMRVKMWYICWKNKYQNVIKITMFCRFFFVSHEASVNGSKITEVSR